MATFEVYRTARTPKQCDNYPRCERGIAPGERYLRASATPHDIEINQGDRWWTLNLCCEHMRPERGCVCGHEKHAHASAPAAWCLIRGGCDCHEYEEKNA